MPSLTPLRQLLCPLLLKVFIGLLAADAFAASDRTLVDLARLDLGSVKSHGTKIKAIGTGTQRCLRVSLDGQTRWPGAVIAAPRAPWDLAAYAYVAVDVRSAAAEMLGTLP